MEDTAQNSGKISGIQRNLQTVNWERKRVREDQKNLVQKNNYRKNIEKLKEQWENK